MGTQFWWFYDVIAGAILLICMFLAGRKGFAKGFIFAVSCVIAAAAAYAVSGPVAESVCKSTIASSNASKINQQLDDEAFTSKSIENLQNMGYSVKIDKDKYFAALSKSEEYDKAIANYLNNVNSRPIETDEDVLVGKIHEAFSKVVEDIVSSSLSKYAGISAGRNVLDKPESVGELLRIIEEENSTKPASEYISENYVTSAYVTLFTLGIFIGIFAALALFFVLVINALAGKKEHTQVSAVSHIAGGLIGIIPAAAFILLAAVIVRLNTLAGSNEMLFFNNTAVEKTYVFKYFYDFVSKF